MQISINITLFPLTNCYVTIDVKQNLYTKSDSTDIIEITTNQIRS